LCTQCHASLLPSNDSRACLPKYALANKLFLGRLPPQFDDVTPMEELACALMRSSIYVYRLYHLTNAQDPFLAKGNSCAFPQPTASTAQILPHTPADIAGTISVVFTGPSKTPPESVLKNVFRIRKNVVSDLLHWLQDHNPLYSGVTIDAARLDMYGSDGALPGIE
ncbi:hypothetical protein DL93DRAFT_2044184, partial [Clavulina sp. PMI_390]